MRLTAFGKVVLLALAAAVVLTAVDDVAGAIVAAVIAFVCVGASGALITRNEPDRRNGFIG